MKKILKTLSGVLALTLVLSSTPSMTANAAIDPFLLQEAPDNISTEPGREGVILEPETWVEKSNHIPQRVDLTPEQIQGLVASTLMVDPEIDENYKVKNRQYILNYLPYQPMYYTSVHSECDITPYINAGMIETVNYLGDYTIGGVLDPTKVVYDARVKGGPNAAHAELTRQRKAGQITYNQWLSAVGTDRNWIDYRPYYRTTYNYAIIVNGQNSPTFNVGTNILAIISPLGDRMYFDVFGLDANGNVYIPDGYHYYNSLLNISYQEYKHKLGICQCTGARDQARIVAIENSWNTAYGIPSTYYVHACSTEATSLLFLGKLPTFSDDEYASALQKINGKRYTPVTIK